MYNTKWTNYKLWITSGSPLWNEAGRSPPGNISPALTITLSLQSRIYSEFSLEAPTDERIRCQSAKGKSRKVIAIRWVDIFSVQWQSSGSLLIPTWYTYVNYVKLSLNLISYKHLQTPAINRFSIVCLLNLGLTQWVKLTKIKLQYNWRYIELIVSLRFLNWPDTGGFLYNLKINCTIMKVIILQVWIDIRGYQGALKS